MQIVESLNLKLSNRPKFVLVERRFKNSAAPCVARTCSVILLHTILFTILITK